MALPGAKISVACIDHFVYKGGSSKPACQIDGRWKPAMETCRQATHLEDRSSYVAMLWPLRQVNYRISKRFDADSTKKILQAMVNIEENSCIRFVKWDGEDFSVGGYIEFEPEAYRKICLSSFGKTPEFRQVIRLAPFCFDVDLRMITSTLLIAVGLPEEHRRPDRDNYIEIVWDNLQPNAKHLFEKYETIDKRLEKTPYDIYSVMHAMPTAFAKVPGLVTIRPKFDGFKILPQTRPTPTDNLKLKNLYCNDQPQDIESVARFWSAPPGQHDSTTKVLSSATTNFPPIDENFLVGPVDGGANGGQDGAYDGGRDNPNGDEVTADPIFW